MKYLVRSILIILVFSIFNTASAQVYFTDIEVLDMKNGQVTLKWNTPTEPTRAFIYWGEDANNLGRWNNYTEYDISHMTFLFGLQKGVTYYYKIVAFDSWGNKTESFLNTFNTKDMADTVLPQFIKTEAVQTTKDAAVIRWETNEDTKATVYYGIRIYELDQKAGYNAYSRDHELILYKMLENQEYYVKVIAQDKSGNKQIQTFTLRTSSSVDKNVVLNVSTIKPISFDSELIKSTEATISWKTNLAAKSRIHYGTVTGKYGKKVDVCKTERCTEHKIVLTELQPNTVYYYKIEIYDAIYGKKLTTQELTFSTGLIDEAVVAPGAEIQINNEITDTDNDGLSDKYEIEIGTDPSKFDSDGDGYGDGSEMKHGWDPNVSGSTPDTRLQAFRYFMPKRDWDYRVAKDRELSLYVAKKFGSKRVSQKNWRVLSDAYIYGGYPAEAIAQAIRFGGKTVHPSIRWQAWKDSEQYGEYIEK